MESLIRALQPSFMAYATLLILAIVVYVFGNFFVGKISDNESGVEKAFLRKVVRYIAVGVVLLTLVIAAFRVLTYASVNRVPRSDVDGSAVYDRMDRNAEPTPPTHL